jgi:hypothetical protein
MTPKEKAKELWLKLLGGNEGNELTIEIDKLIAKQDALICVDEILNVVNPLTLEYEYWEEVEQEIKKL